MAQHLDDPWWIKLSKSRRCQVCVTFKIRKNSSLVLKHLEKKIYSVRCTNFSDWKVLHKSGVPPGCPGRNQSWVDDYIRHYTGHLARPTFLYINLHLRFMQCRYLHKGNDRFPQAYQTKPGESWMWHIHYQSWHLSMWHPVLHTFVQLKTSSALINSSNPSFLPPSEATLLLCVLNAASN